MKSKDIRYDVLKVKIIAMNNKLSAVCIDYQDTEVLKRGEFADEEIGVISSSSPEYYDKQDAFYILGTNKDEDIKVIILENMHALTIMNKVDKINEKYGLLKKPKAKRGEKYWYFRQNMRLYSTVETGSHEDNLRYDRNNYFEVRTEAVEVLNKIEQLLQENSILKEQK